MTDRALLQQALEALEKHAMQRTYAGGVYIANVAIALRDRLAQPEQEPVAHTLNCVCGAVWDVSPDGVEEMVHAPNPPQRKPLTDEEALELWNKHEKHWRFENNALAFTRAIEAAHGIKGGA